MLLAAVAPVLQLGGGDFLVWALGFFVLAIIAAALGMGNVAGISMDVAKILVVVFLVLAVLALLL